jgi:diguanylate cyclase (GGDEF)-like protein/PAS domain S-box-containing protein
MAGVPHVNSPFGASVVPRDVRDPDAPLALAQRWRTFVGESPIGIFEIDLEGRCVFVNPAFERLTGLPAQDALGSGWQRAIHDHDLALLRPARAHENTSPFEVQLRTLDGSERWASARAIPLRTADGAIAGYLGTLEDITERRHLEARLEHDATHDRLTGLGSRALLVEAMTAALARIRRGGRGIALLYIDLDWFKRVNEMLGHDAGDAVLVQVAERLRVATRGTDVCARLGGDEFVVCGADVDSIVHASILAERVLSSLGEPYNVHGHEVFITASIGIAIADGEDLVSVDQMLSHADAASYRAKQEGRARVEIFDDDLRRQLAQTRRIARAVARLLDLPRVPLLCSPIVNLGDGEVIGFDCAVDWADAGVDNDIETITRVVEETGMSRALDHGLIRTVVAQLAEWEHKPPGAIVPGLSLVLTRAGATSPVMPEFVHGMLTRSRVTPGLCWLGLPESAVAKDLDAVSRVVTSLQELGVGVALRDFGSGVGSLEQLRRLPTPTMTIAGPLVEAAHVANDDMNTSLLAAIVQYARALGRIVVAMGVQDAEHAQRLRDLGCSFGSGPAFGPRLRPEDVGSFLAARQRDDSESSPA